MTPNSYLVTQAKAVTFILEAVLYRPKRTGGRAKKGAAIQQVEAEYAIMQPGEDMSLRPPPSLAGATVNQYIAGLVDLWTDQKERGVINPSKQGYGHPRESASMKSLIKITKLTKMRTDRAQFKDRAESKLRPSRCIRSATLTSFFGADTFIDAITTVDQLANTMRYNLERNTIEGVRDFAMYLMTFALFQRGGNTREAELADLHVSEFPNEGASRCPVFVLVSHHSKTVQDGQKTSGGWIRSKNILACPCFGLALHFFALSVGERES